MIYLSKQYLNIVDVKWDETFLNNIQINNYYVSEFKSCNIVDRENYTFADLYNFSQLTYNNTCATFKNNFKKMDINDYEQHFLNNNRFSKLKLYNGFDLRFSECNFSYYINIINFLKDSGKYNYIFENFETHMNLHEMILNV